MWTRTAEPRYTDDITKMKGKFDWASEGPAEPAKRKFPETPICKIARIF